MVEIVQPPNNLDAERAFLGCILIDNSAYDLVKSEIGKQHFYSSAHQTIYSVITSIIDRKTHVDLITLSASLKDIGVLDTVGGMSYVAELMNIVPSSSSIVTYMKIVKEKYVRRKLMEVADRFVTIARESSDNIEDVLDKAGGYIQTLKNVAGVQKEDGNDAVKQMIKKLESEIVTQKNGSVDKGQVERLHEIAKSYSGDDELISSLSLVEKIKNQPKELQMMTGYSEMDNILKGFRLGQLVSLSAVAKSGKTSFAIALTGQMKMYNPVWFPFEEGAEELVAKFIERNTEPPLFYVPKDTHDRSLQFIELKILEAKAKHDSKIFFIDNLDWIVDPRSQNHDRDIQHVCMELKRMAVEWKVCILLIAHVKKLETATKQPDYNDIKGSSSIYQISDTVMMLWRETKRNEFGEMVITNNVNLSIPFNRKCGKTGNVKMIYENGDFREYDWRQDDDTFGDFSDRKLSQKTLDKTF